MVKVENLSFVVETFNDGMSNVFIVRQILQPNMPAKVCCVATHPDEIADFFGSVFDNSDSNTAA